VTWEESGWWMIQIRKAKERGYFDFGWLKTYHTFSFGDYYDPEQMGFQTLRVINEDFVEPGQGFGTHPHRDMEIITYILEGKLEHKDSMENGSVIAPGEIQRMSAGTGVTHSEFNPSKTERVHLLQIWILPEKKGIQPEYEQKKIDRKKMEGRLQLIASPEPHAETVLVHQDVHLYASSLKAKSEVIHDVTGSRSVWLQTAKGVVDLNGHSLHAGDGAAIQGEKKLKLKAIEETDFLLFDMG